MINIYINCKVKLDRSHKPVIVLTTECPDFMANYMTIGRRIVNLKEIGGNIIDFENSGKTRS